MNKNEFRQLIREEIRKVLKENKPTAVPVSGKKYTDDQILKFLSKNDVDMWLELFTDEFRDGFDEMDAVSMANDWLWDNGYEFEMKSVFTNDDGETLKWTIK